jgi:hypothetical protein
LILPKARIEGANQDPFSPFSYDEFTTMGQIMCSLERIELGVALITLALLSSKAYTAEGGYSNYVPGTFGDFAASLEPATALTIRNDVYYYSADVSSSVRSGQVNVDAELTFTIDFATILYKPGIQLFGANYSLGVVAPLAKIDIETSTSAGSFSRNIEEDSSGLGDVTLVPMLLFWNSGNYHFTLGEYIVTPTGDYNKDEFVNVSLNYWTFDTNFGMTYLNLDTGQDYSFNIGYSYNTENDDTDYQSGGEIHIDYMFNQFLSETFAVGLQGFYLKQISGDSGDGALLGSYKAESAGVGPAVMWIPGTFEKRLTLIAKYLNEYDAENRLKGEHLFVSFALSL